MATSSENIRLIGQLSTVGLSFVFALVLSFLITWFARAAKIRAQEAA